MNTLRVGHARCRCGHRRHGTKLIAVTGGPGGGKSAVLELATRVFCEHVGVLPETATILFGGGFPRHDSEPGRRAAQRAIYRVQREVEAMVAEEGIMAIALCDRGTVDGLAYWPGETAEFWAQFGTTEGDELARYAAVVHLHTPGLSEGYDHSNSLRVESAEQAAALDQRVLDAWAAHPHRLVIPSEDDFLDKARNVLATIRALLPACCQHHPLSPT